MNHSSHQSWTPNNTPHSKCKPFSLFKWECNERFIIKEAGVLWIIISSFHSLFKFDFVVFVYFCFSACFFHNPRNLISGYEKQNRFGILVHKKRVETNHKCGIQYPFTGHNNKSIISLYILATSKFQTTPLIARRVQWNWELRTVHGPGF